MSRKRKATHRVYLDHPAIGCGWRGLILQKMGHKWVHLTEAATEINFKIPVEMWEEARPIEIKRGKFSYLES